MLRLELTAFGSGLGKVLFGSTTVPDGIMTVHYLVQINTSVDTVGATEFLVNGYGHENIQEMLEDVSRISRRVDAYS